MIGRICTAPFSAISRTNDSDQDILEMVGTAGYPFRVLAIEMSSALTTDERLTIRLLRRSTTGSGGSALTPVNVNGGIATTVQTAVNSLVTTPGTAGAVLHAWQWSQLAPFIYRPTPAELIMSISAGRLALHLGTAVASTRTISGFVTWEEFG